MKYTLANIVAVTAGARWGNPMDDKVFRKISVLITR
jgi:hypothetical protein